MILAAARHGRARSGGRLHDPRPALATSPRPSRQAQPERSIFLGNGRGRGRIRLSLNRAFVVSVHPCETAGEYVARRSLSDVGR
jgi:hypothetical protein